MNLVSPLGPHIVVILYHPNQPISLPSLRTLAVAELMGSAVDEYRTIQTANET